MDRKLDGRKVLIIVENLPVPFDRRVWQEAQTLVQAGCRVSIICPKSKGYERAREEIDGISIYRHSLPTEGRGQLGYLLEYGVALFWEFFLAWKVLLHQGFEAIHACNPPDNIFLIGGFFKFFLGKKFLFDHHDINPELYLAKFGRQDMFYRLILALERLTFRTADVSIATNESYKRIAVERGGMRPEEVFVVRSGPDLDRVRFVPPNPEWKNGRRFLVGYVGVMGQQEGLDLLLEGCALLVQRYNRRDVQFVLVGAGTELESLKEQVKQAGLDEYVTFTGRVPDETLMEILSTADVCVNPDVVNEMNDKSSMNKIVEYMALGKPIVQFDMTEGRYSAREASVYAEPNDPESLIQHVLALLDDPQKRERMGQFGRRRVLDELAWNHQVPRLLEAYRALFSS